MIINISTKAINVVLLVSVALMYYTLDKRIDTIEQVIEQAITTEEGIHYSDADLDCLTKNVYYEAGTENEIGKIAVATVTVNRLKTGHWGKNVCDVVYAPGQFSWTRHAVKSPDQQRWYESRHVAHQVLNGIRARGLEHSLYYHANYIKEPNWADPAEKTLKIGSHIFYNRAKNSSLAI
jgi:spore germination cell wall hydrolase CwlJ-like protein